MGRAKIVNGIWSRHVTWEKNGVWRTDMFKTTLADERLRSAVFILANGVKITIPVNELRRILSEGADHYSGKIWGPFNIDPSAKTLEGKPVRMEVT
jgi:hypothetical protein